MKSKFSIAVLPFMNMSSDAENEYFSDGITEEIINALSKIEGLHVTARTSAFAFKHQNIDVREIGKRLNVALLLEGSIRKSNNVVRITAQLTRADNGFHEWSDTWDRELKNIFIVQDEIAAIIAKKINSDIQPSVNKGGLAAANTEAIDLYLRGNHLLHQWDFSEKTTILNCFQKAIALDPKLIKAYVGLSNAYTWLSSTGHLSPIDTFPKIEHCIQTVITLDKNTPDVYIVIAGKNFWMEWDFPTALYNINRALELQPSNSNALKYKGMILAAMGLVEEALDSLFQAVRLDPYGDQIYSAIGMIYNWTNDNSKALEYIEKSIQFCPHWYAHFMDQVAVLCKLKRFNEAWETIEKLSTDPRSPLSVAHLKAVYFAFQNRIPETFEQLEIMEKEEEIVHKIGSPNAALFCQIYLLLGKTEKALDYLEEGIQQHSTPLLFVRIDEIWSGLRTNPRYLKAIKHFNCLEQVLSSDKPTKKYKKTGLSNELANQVKTKLNELMLKEQPYLNPTLTLSDLSEALEITTNQLSQILNESLRKNFYDFVNGYRLEYFMELRKMKKYKNYTLLSQAYECGFNSKTTFNTFFKKTKGTTPSEFLKLK